MGDLRGAIDEAEAQVVLLLVVVHIEASRDLILEVRVHRAGVVHDLDLPHSGHSQQHVLVVDEGVFASVQGPVVVPFGPIEAVQQRALSVLFTREDAGSCSHLSPGPHCCQHSENERGVELTIQKSAMVPMD